MTKKCYWESEGYCYNEDVVYRGVDCPYARRHPDDPELVFCTKGARE